MRGRGVDVGSRQPAHRLRPLAPGTGAGLGPLGPVRGPGPGTAAAGARGASSDAATGRASGGATSRRPGASGRDGPGPGAPPDRPVAGTGPAEPEGEAGALASPAQAEPPLPATPGPPVVEPPPPRRGWLEGGRYVVEQKLGDLVETFDLFFDKNRKLDLESPSSRFRFKTFVRTAEDVDFATGFAVAASVKLPRLERWLGNARLLVVGERARPSVVPPPVDKSGPGGETLTPAEQSDAAAAELARGRGRTELRFDVVRRGLLVFDAGVGVRLVWPPVPYVNFRAHLRLQLGAGFLLRATDTLFVEFWGRNPGTNFDLEVERYLSRPIPPPLGGAWPLRRA